MLRALGLLEKASEFARVYGCELCAVMARGSQYKVESVLYRALRLSNMLPYTPAKAQVRAMQPPAHIALTLGAPITSSVLSHIHSISFIMLVFNLIYNCVVKLANH